MAVLGADALGLDDITQSTVLSPGDILSRLDDPLSQFVRSADELPTYQLFDALID